MFPLVWVSVGIFCGLVSYSAKLWGQSPDVFLPIVTTIVYGLIVGLPFGWPWPHGTFIGPFNIYLTHAQKYHSPRLTLTQHMMAGCALNNNTM